MKNSSQQLIIIMASFLADLKDAANLKIGEIANGNLILPDLYLGSWRTANDLEFLLEHNIKSILTVGHSMPPPFENRFSYKVLVLICVAI